MVSTWTGSASAADLAILAHHDRRSPGSPHLYPSLNRVPSASPPRTLTSDRHCSLIKAMEETPPGPVDISLVAHLIDGIVTTERRCAREHAARVAVRRTTPPENHADERQFYHHAAEMLSATAEAEKWNPLVAALRSYEVRDPGKERELLLVWNPVYEAVKVYKEARFLALGGGRLAQLAERPVPNMEKVSPRPLRCATQAGPTTSDTGNSAGRHSSASTRLAAPATLLLPPVKPLSGDVPIVQDLLASIQAGSLGVTRPNGGPPAPGAATVVDGAATGARAGAADGARDPSEHCARVQPVYDRDLLVRTASVLQQAVGHLEVLAINRIRSWPTEPIGFAAYEQATVPLGPVMEAAAVSFALDHSATEIKKQLVAVDAPHEDLFVGLDIHLNGPASAFHGAHTGSDKDES